MYGNNPYMRNYSNSINEQNMYEQIDSQINQLQQMRNQIKNNLTQQAGQHQPTSINQTFQLAPNGNGGIRYVNSIDDVEKETVFVDTPYFSKDLTVMWLKGSNGSIRAYELNEIVKKDEKDLQIELLMAQVNELKGMIKNEQSHTNVTTTEDTTNTKWDDDTDGTATKEDKPTSVQRVSTSKKK